MPRHWLMKSEPDVYSMEDLERDKRTFWDGVRNYEARNLMRDEMKVGDLAFFYHSNANPSGVAGIARIASEAKPDPTALDAGDPHFDPDSDPTSPRWWAVDVEFVEALPRLVSLHEIKANPKLAEMSLLRRSRLSVTPVSAAEWREVVRMAKA